MRQRLIIRLGNQPTEPVQWLWLNAEGRPDGGVQRGSLNEAAAAAGGRPAIALLPGFEVLLLTARIPTQSRQKMLRAIPYALEDQLADDIDELHFVAGRHDAGGQLTVAVVAKHWLAQWLEACAAAGLEIEQAHPELLALPYERTSWTLLIEDDSFMLRTGAQSGFVGDLCNLLPLLQAALDEAGEAAPGQLEIYGNNVPEELATLDLEITRYPAPQPLLTLAAHLDGRSSIDMRSGEFSRKRALGNHWRRWRLAAALLLTWVVIDTGAAHLQQWQHRQELAELDQQIQQIYQQAFPGAGRLVNPRQQVENRLRALRGGDTGTQQGLLDLLSVIGPVLRAEQDMELGALNYRNGEIDLEVFTGNLQAVDELKRKLDSVNGINAEVRNARAEGERVQGRLRIGAS